MSNTDQFDCDILIVGGGINGTGIARDAAGRGYSVILAEMADLASGTSSASTKLIHGGLRYLEHYEFRLVREALIEREVLWRIAPHIIRPLRFVLPHHRGLRPAWLLRLGLFLYDHLGGRKRLPATRTLNLRTHPAGEPLQDTFVRGFEYSDAWVQDARLVVLNARDAADRGAEVLVRTKVTALMRRDEAFEATLSDLETGRERRVRARLVINAGGPWVDKVISLATGEGASNVRMVQGSHIVVKKLYDHDRCYIFQNGDGRIIFAIPYEQDFTLVGTTDRDYRGDPGRVAISDEETAYLLHSVSAYFKRPVTQDDLVWSYSGVRPLYDDGASQAQEATRDYVLKRDKGAGGATLINIFGGKITTYRRLAEAVMAMVETDLGARGKSWTAHKPLPGGSFAVDALEDLVAALKRRAPAAPDGVIRRLATAYGTLAQDIIDVEGGLGEHIGGGLCTREVDYLMTREWARESDDILWRRSKLGLRLSTAEQLALERYMAERRAEENAAPAQEIAQRSAAQ